MKRMTTRACVLLAAISVGACAADDGALEQEVAADESAIGQSDTRGASDEHTQFFTQATWAPNRVLYTRFTRPRGMRGSIRGTWTATGHDGSGASVVRSGACTYRAIGTAETKGSAVCEAELPSADARVEFSIAATNVSRVTFERSEN